MSCSDGRRRLLKYVAAACSVHHDALGFDLHVYAGQYYAAIVAAVILWAVGVLPAVDGSSFSARSESVAVENTCRRYGGSFVREVLYSKVLDTTLS